MCSPEPVSITILPLCCVLSKKTREQTHRLTDRLTDTQTKYRTPCCACTLRVKRVSLDVYVTVYMLSHALLLIGHNTLKSAIPVLLIPLFLPHKWCNVYLRVSQRREVEIEEVLQEIHKRRAEMEEVGYVLQETPNNFRWDTNLMKPAFYNCHSYQ